MGTARTGEGERFPDISKTYDPGGRSREDLEAHMMMMKRMAAAGAAAVALGGGALAAAPAVAASTTAAPTGANAAVVTVADHHGGHDHDGCTFRHVYSSTDHVRYSSTFSSCGHHHRGHFDHGFDHGYNRGYFDHGYSNFGGYSRF
ncbi:hypothetical protein ACFY4C_23325 [Actinomadura viridis]|uniref:hypothetical protein n=1 Tax=Actinomadura viridis TaxID=58110 RepID=UPI003697BB34